MVSLPPESTTDLTSEQVKTLYPPDLSLQYVQIFFRHGERTPVRHRLQNAGIPPFWNLCRAADDFRATTVLPNNSFHSLQYRRRVENPDSKGRLTSANQTGDRYCLLGELTDQGRFTTMALGERIRNLYVDKLGFLPQTLEDENILYLRTSHIQRTIDSMIQVFSGLYPKQHVKAIPNFHVRLVNHENLYPNDNFCARLKNLSEEYSVKAAVEWDPKLKISSQILSKWIPDGITVNGRPKATGIFDTITSCIANGIGLPSELMDEGMRRDVEGAAVAEWFNGYLENEVYRRLGVGPLLGDILDRFTYYSSATTEKQKMALYGTHDTTIAALLSTLGVFDNRWPHFTSNVTFELFKAQRGGLLSFLYPIITGDEYFVRMKYNQTVVKLPACKSAGKHRDGDESLCTLAAFREVIEKVRPVDWSAECRVPEVEKSPQYQPGAHQ